MDECSICLDEFSNGEECCTISCGHKFHTNCIEGITEHKHFECPLCRNIFELSLKSEFDILIQLDTFSEFKHRVYTVPPHVTCINNYEYLISTNKVNFDEKSLYFVPNNVNSDANILITLNNIRKITLITGGYYFKPDNTIIIDFEEPVGVSRLYRVKIMPSRYSTESFKKFYDYISNLFENECEKKGIKIKNSTRDPTNKEKN